MNWRRWLNSTVYGIAMLGILNVIDGGKRESNVPAAVIAGVLVLLSMYASDWVWDRGHGHIRPMPGMPPPDPSQMERLYAAALADNAVLSKQAQQLRALSSMALHACDKLSEEGHRPWCKAAGLVAESKSYKAADCTCGVVQYGILLTVAKSLAAEHLDDEKRRSGHDLLDPRRNDNG